MVFLKLEQEQCLHLSSLNSSYPNVFLPHHLHGSIPSKLINSWEQSPPAMTQICIDPKVHAPSYHTHPIPVKHDQYSCESITTQNALNYRCRSKAFFASLYLSLTHLCVQSMPEKIHHYLRMIQILYVLKISFVLHYLHFQC